MEKTKENKQIISFTDTNKKQYTNNYDCFYEKHKNNTKINKVEKQNAISDKISPNINNLSSYNNKPKHNIPKKLGSNFIYILLIITIVLPKINSNINKEILLSKAYTITLKINKSGIHRIFYSGNDINSCGEISYNPDDITINEITNPTVTDGYYNFQHGDNTIILSWNNELVTFICLFNRCTEVNEIDLSNFDISNAKDMQSMFLGCSSLTSIKFGDNNPIYSTNTRWMFHGCSSLAFLNLSNFETSSVVYMDSMFCGCSSLTSVILSSFNTGNVITMGEMFHYCSSLKSLDLSHFNTEKVEIIFYMFNECRNLTYLDVSNFNTSSVTVMDRVFKGCSSLTTLDVSKFDTSKVYNIADMFSECSSIKTLDLSKFKTSEVIHWDGMFNGCHSLTSLDLHNFHTPKAQYMFSMFNECTSLEYLDISNFNTENVVRMEYMFNGCISLTTLEVSKFNTGKVENMRIMFGNCQKLTSLDVSHFNTERVFDMGLMFYECRSLENLDLSNFKTSTVTAMDWMFEGCEKLKSLDVSKFDTSNVNNMELMFHRCKSLTSLDLSNFDTSKVITMKDMVSHCNELTIINLANFNTSSVSIMQGMFAEDYKLISLNLNHFDTSKVRSMDYMFYRCLDLKALNIHNFDTSSVENMENMFYECKKLTSLEISNFSTSKVKSMANMLSKCISVPSIDVSHFDTSLVTSFINMFRDTQMVSLDLSTFNPININNIHGMFVGCNKLTSLDLSKLDTSNVIDMGYIFDGCNDLKFIDLKKMTIKENTTIEGMINLYSKNLVLCIDDKPSFNKVISLYHCSFINCAGDWGENKNKISPEENNICINGCLLSKYNERCYQNCSYYFYFDESLNKYLCTEKAECPKGYNKLIHGKNECIKSCENTKEHKFEYNNNCLIKCPENFIALKEKGNYCTPQCPKESPFLYLDSLKCTSGCTIIERQNKICIANYIPTKEDNFNILDKVIEQTRYELFNNFDPSVVNGKFIEENGAKIIIKRTNEGNDNDNAIDLSECEELLKEHYNISKNESLFMLRIDIEQVGMAVPTFEYELLFPIDSPNLKKLNLTVCKDVKVDVTIPFNISDDLEKYNSSSPYYNDICYITDSEDGTDISLSDRKQDYYNNNMTICEEGCDFISYNTETQKAVCSCGIKTDIPFLDNVKIDKDLLMSSFTDISNIANTKMMTCYKTVFQKKLILKNLGCFIFGALIALNFVCFFMLLFSYYKKLVQKIQKIKISLLNNAINKNNIDQILNNNRVKFNKEMTINNNFFNSSERKMKNNTNKINKNKKHSIKSIKLNGLNNKHSPPKTKKIIKIKELNINNNNNKKLSFIKNSVNNSRKNKKNNNKKNNFILSKNKGNNKRNSLFQKKLILKLTSAEINSLSYEEAIIKDKRAFLEYYFSLLKINHLALFIFNNEDYNIPPIKFSIIYSLSVLI